MYQSIWILIDVQVLHIRSEKGFAILNGEQAEGVVRFRHIVEITHHIQYLMGTMILGRIKTQREFLKY